MDLKKAMDFVMNDDNARVRQDGDKVAYIPSRMFSYPVDKSLIEKYKVVNSDELEKITPLMQFTVPKSSVYKNDLMILDLIANNNWKRPVYFAGAADAKTYLGLQDYFSMEGLSYKLVPIHSPGGNANTGFGKINADKTYENLMKNYRWGKMNEKGVNVDYYIRRTMTNNYRLLFLNLGQHYAGEGKTAETRLNYLNGQIKQLEDTLATGKVLADKVNAEIAKAKAEIPALEKRKSENYDKLKKLMRRCFEVMPEENVPFDRIVPSMIPMILQSGDTEYGKKLLRRILALEMENLAYYTSLKPRFATGVTESASISYRIVRLIEGTVQEFKLSDMEKEIQQKKQIAESYIQSWFKKLNEYDAENGTSYSGQVAQSFQ
jgi:hypothetical protein